MKIEHNLRKGFAYSINDKESEVHININTGWVCIGETITSDCQSVEFINNCVAVISKKGKLLSLWLKPKSLAIFNKYE